MRKTFLGLAIIAAMATPLALATSANAAVGVDNGIGHVDKGDVQLVLGYNDAMQENAASIEFTSVETSGRDSSAPATTAPSSTTTRSGPRPSRSMPPR